MDYIFYIITTIAIYSILSMSLNLLLGYTGMFSFAQAAIFGVGAYTAGIAITKFNVSYPFVFVLAIIIAIVLSFFLEWILSHFKSDYYILTSIGICVITQGLFLNLQDLTNGPIGISNIKTLGGTAGITILVVLLITLAVYILYRYITKSHFGRVLQSIRDNELVPKVFNYNTKAYKITIFTIASIFSAIAGILYASYIGLIDPYMFSVSESILIFSMVVVGGLASLEGSILGAIFFVLLPEILRFVGFSPEVSGQARLLCFGLVLVVLMFVRPKGFLGKFKF